MRKIREKEEGEKKSNRFTLRISFTSLLKKRQVKFYTLTIYESFRDFFPVPNLGLVTVILNRVF